MTSIIKFSLKELNTLINDENSCVSKKTVTQNIAFQPWCLSNLKDSVEKIMDYKIGKFDKELNGIILSYKNVKVLDDLCAIRQDSSEIYSDVQADLYVFQPHVGATLHGIINKKSVTHLGVLVHRVFNVVIPRPSDEPGSKWIGAQASVGQKITFKIVVLDLFGALPYIRGYLDENSLPDDNDNTQTDELDSLTVSHVNFDGTKPMPAKSFSSASKENNETYETSNEIHSPRSEHSGSKKLKDELNNTKRKDKSKEVSVKKYIDSDDDSISDVDDDLMTTQANMIEKIMKLDKSQRALGIRAPVGVNSTGISRIDKSKPTKSTFVEVSTLKTAKKPYSKDVAMEMSKLNKVNMEDGNCHAARKQNIKSLSSGDLSNISLINGSSKKGSSPNISNIHKKKSKSSHASSEQNKKDGSFDIKNIPGQTVLITSTPIPDEIIKFKNKFIPNNASATENNDIKKKLSFSNASYDSTLRDTALSRLDDGANTSSKNKKRKRKSSDSSTNISDTLSYDSTLQNTTSSRLNSDGADLSLKNKKRKRKSSDSSANISDTLGYDSTLQNTALSRLNDGTDISLKNKKHKRKSSGSSINVSDVISDQLHSDASIQSPHKKKRKKNNCNGDLEKADSNTEVKFMMPLNADEILCDKKTIKKRKLSLTSEEAHNAEAGNSSNGRAASLECDDVESSKKHSKKRSASKSVCAQEIFSQIESDPSLLEEIQLLLKARANKRKDN